MDSLYKFVIFASIFLFIIFYPMFISIYVFLPLLIGIMGYLLMQGIEKGKISYILISLFYFINLEINLSLPLCLTIFSSLFVYIFIYSHLRYFYKCKICKPLLSVLILNIVYVGFLLSHDFIFQTSSVVIDNLLLYSLIVDLLIVVII